jgi:phosphogluconate dehydratase
MSPTLNPVVAEVTARIAARSADARAAYLELVASRRPAAFARKRLADSNLAHVAAACPAHDKTIMLGGGWPNIGVVTAYNDMLSAHQPFERFPELIREAARGAGAIAQVAGGVPAMCDGVTQGAEGMELSLLSRDVIAMAAGVALSHDAFDAAIYLGVCDKIVPGLLIAALRFGWVPGIFAPAGPMPSGLPNPDKARIRQLFAEGKVDRAALLQAEAQSYHAPGTCTFYGTANSNQLLMEAMGLHMPGAAFANPGTQLRDAFTRDLEASVQAALRFHGIDYIPGCADMGDFDATSTAVGVFPCGALGKAPEPHFTNTFERYWAFFRDRRDGVKPWKDYTPYEMRLCTAMIMLGHPERAHELLDWFFEHQLPRGWNSWGEIVWSDGLAPRFIGDMPHT